VPPHDSSKVEGPSRSPASPLDRARRKAYRRLIPLVFLCYVIAYIDRSNVSIAKLTMMKDLGFDDRVFANGFGLFFIGYFLLEIPGAVLVERWSARKWISRIMVTWGIIAALNAIVRTAGEFYLMRFLLGLAEAGFFPGVIVYLTHWFPERDRARALALIIIAAPIAQMINAPICGLLLNIGTTEIINGVTVVHPRLLGLTGWQLIYIVWGIPAVVLGIVVYYTMTDRPAQARWLDPDERMALEEELARERAAFVASGARQATFLKVITNPAVLLLAAANFSIVCGHYGAESFLPTILKQWYQLPNRVVTWLVPLPFVAMMLGQLLVSWSSDRTGERWWHTALPMYVGGLALLLTPLSRGHLWLTVLCFAIALCGIRSYLAPFYALPKLFLQGAAAAGAIGFINAIANLGGFVGPRMMAGIEKSTGSFQGGLFFIAGTSTLAATFVVILKAYHRRLQQRAGLTH
jgi:ACS family tartrate transporter-like MFS transporter